MLLCPGFSHLSLSLIFFSHFHCSQTSIILLPTHPKIPVLNSASCIAVSVIKSLKLGHSPSVSFLEVICFDFSRMKKLRTRNPPGSRFPISTFLNLNCNPNHCGILSCRLKAQHCTDTFLYQSYAWILPGCFASSKTPTTPPPTTGFLPVLQEGASVFDLLWQPRSSLRGKMRYWCSKIQRKAFSHQSCTDKAFVCLSLCVCAGEEEIT